MIDKRSEFSYISFISAIFHFFLYSNRLAIGSQIFYFVQIVINYLALAKVLDSASQKEDDLMKDNEIHEYC